MDGKFGQYEWDSIIEMVAATTRGCPAELLLKSVDDVAHFVTNLPKERWPGLFINARSFSIDRKNLILDMCLRVSVADGPCIKQEREFIGQMAAWIDMSVNDFEAWKLTEKARFHL